MAKSHGVKLTALSRTWLKYYRKLRRVVECSVIPVVVQFETSRDRKDCIRFGSGLSGAMCAGEVRVLIRRSDNVRTSANFHGTTPTPRNVNEMEFGMLSNGGKDQLLHGADRDGIQVRRGFRELLLITAVNDSVYVLDAH